MVYIVDEKNGFLTGEIFENERKAICAVVDYYGYWDYDYIFINDYDEEEYKEMFGVEDF